MVNQTKIPDQAEREAFTVRVVREPVLVAHNTYEICVAKPSPTYSFCAGQSMKFCFGEEKCRSFSMVSAPHENYLRFVYRGSSSTLKKNLAQLQKDTEVRILDARGVCTYPEKENVPVLMLTGGVGVAPCMSMLRHATYIRDTRTFVLLYANRHVHDIVYKDELEAFRNTLRFSVEFFITGETTSQDMHQGRFTVDTIKEYIKKLGEPIVYVIGPEGMVDATLSLLERLSYPEENIKVRKFTGYIGEDDT